ncbi:MAG: DoxX family membrane protein [Opitutales bacterium]
MRQTCDSKPLLFLRVAGGLPLLFYGGLHLIQPVEFESLLHAVGLEPAGGMVVVVPLVEMVAGIILLAGVWARVGALLAVLAMVPAFYTWMTLAKAGSLGMNVATIPQVPPLWMPVLVMLCALAVLARGAGACSADFRLTQWQAENDAPDTAREAG